MPRTYKTGPRYSPYWEKVFKHQLRRAQPVPTRQTRTSRATAHIEYQPSPREAVSKLAKSRFLERMFNNLRCAKV